MGSIARTAAWFPAPHGSAFCRWCGHVVTAQGATFPRLALTPLPWARQRCTDSECESDAVLESDGSIVAASGTFPSRNL
ncbi:MAG: hypothetical protein ABSF69_16175 [Polyangiaceae bacterium]